jgi:signal transduction histidine kinase
VAEIERQIGWTTHAQWAAGTVEQRRFDYVRLLRQVPAITELVQLDAAGKEQLKVSRLAMDVVGSGIDHSGEPRFTEAVAKRIWFSPVYFRKESEPYMTVAIARSGRNAGVTVAEVNLKLIWDVISTIKVGKAGYAYVVDRQGRLIAHPDISLVLRNTDLAHLPQVAVARSALDARPASDVPPVSIAADRSGGSVLSAYAPIQRLGWLVFVELPLREALAPLYAALAQTAGLLAGALGLAAVAGLVLARRMVGPIRQLEAGAARLGSGDLGHRIDIRTGDELERLADGFNAMAGQIQESHASLEAKVEERTDELARSVEELQALGETGQAVSGTLDLGRVLDLIASRAMALGQADACAVFRYDRRTREFSLWRAAGLDDADAQRFRSLEIRESETAMAKAVRDRSPMMIENLAALPNWPLRDAALAVGLRSTLIVPLVRAERVFGTLTLMRRETSEFSPRTIDLMQTFANQSVLAIQNARLFREIEEKGRQLALASQHKSQFLANMSHELRTPLNAVLGYAELLIDGLYGELPDKARDVLERMQSNGRHLLALINDVLDLSKIEAGELTLAVEDYSLAGIVQSVAAVAEPLARAKGLELRVSAAEGMPLGRGDERRLSQVLLNLVGNAIKFTDAGSVEIAAGAVGDRFQISVTDTGPGIEEADQERIFEAFQQVDNSSTRKKGGTGLGLAISKRIVEMHGGAIAVQSAPGRGSTFRIVVPIRVDEVMEAAE